MPEPTAEQRKDMGSYKKRFPAHQRRKHRQQKLRKHTAPAPASSSLENDAGLDPAPTHIASIIDWADGVLAEMEQGGWGHRKKHVRARGRALGYPQELAKSDSMNSSTTFNSSTSSMAPDPFLAKLAAVEVREQGRADRVIHPPRRAETPIVSTGD